MKICPWECFPDLWNLSGTAHPSAVPWTHWGCLTLGDPQKGFEHFCHLEHFQEISVCAQIAQLELDHPQGELNRLLSKKKVVC